METCGRLFVDICPAYEPGRKRPTALGRLEAIKVYPGDEPEREQPVEYRWLCKIRAWKNKIGSSPS